MTLDVNPHQSKRKSCIECGRKHSANVHRFHYIKGEEEDPFCDTHRTTEVGRKYCIIRHKKRNIYRKKKTYTHKKK